MLIDRILIIMPSVAERGIQQISDWRNVVIVGRALCTRARDSSRRPSSIAPGTLLGPAAKLFVMALVSALFSAPVLADDAWPTRPVKLVVPFPPGGGADRMARVIAAPLSQRLGQPVVIENRSGGAGTVGVAASLRAPADGYTFVWCTPAAQYLAPPTVPYQPMKDVAPVSLTVVGTYLLVANPSLPYRTLEDLIADAKRHPGAINYAIAGLGGHGQLMGEFFNQKAGIKLTPTPYAGEGPALVGVIGGDVQVGFISSSIVLPQVAAGKLRVLGATSELRLRGIPDDILPIAHTLPGYDVTAINYIATRAGTPQPIIERMSRAINEVLSMPAIKAQGTEGGIELVGSTPQELGARIIAERKKWHEFLQQSHIELK
ncbi:tripartite tricarboxylate transporter substrate-binding protein [Cupriavidus taiwanensis]|uniref:Bug family tripartite tricarboxylate transporter substrate binding protein n=1 Tax=Cupriavidus taiwanensis TaxID=164546 RepID=UPI000E12CD1D|nr:tripartite tricarboxylate transporter substrate-binding protein [Cupriavidus taiwanensis]SOZ29637.1 putative Protein BugT [Cupriavidus taiwanensis]SPA34460.1 putative Protein BugT [Cupriavidus taiwanensis]